MLTVYTIGHSTRTLDEFLNILKSYGVQELVDIRTVPKSRHNPQYNTDLLADSLNKHHIGYIHIKELGGFRKPRADSPNKGWQHPAFRGFADYMQTPGFEEGLSHLLKIAHQKKTVIMCAEAVPWRCHRRLIGDALVIRGIKVIDIFTATESRPHIVTPGALVEGTHITYPEKVED